eukprot:2033256-Pleurochrysis_carterae.AAC.2
MEAEVRQGSEFQSERKGTTAAGSDSSRFDKTIGRRNLRRCINAHLVARVRNLTGDLVRIAEDSHLSKQRKTRMSHARQRRDQWQNGRYMVEANLYPFHERRFGLSFLRARIAAPFKTTTELSCILLDSAVLSSAMSGNAVLSSAVLGSAVLGSAVLSSAVLGSAVLGSAVLGSTVLAAECWAAECWPAVCRAA